jgi:AcrR family transcriptional regulator
MKTTRTYRQSARATATERTRRSIIAATIDLQSERLAAEVSLDAIAERSGVSVATILRHFGSRAALIDASISAMNAQVAEERRAPTGDVDAAMRILLDHYEQRGDFALLMLAQENSYDHVRRMTDVGKRLHRSWVAEVFGPWLPESPAARTELLDLLVVATDVYTWKLLRRDRGLSRTTTQRRMTALVTAVLPDK